LAIALQRNVFLFFDSLDGTNSIRPDLIAIATDSKQSGIHRTVLFTLSAEILAQSLLMGDDPSDLQALFNSPTFQ
jgi:hypothetical protein